MVIIRLFCPAVLGRANLFCPAGAIFALKGQQMIKSINTSFVNRY
jgi:hypothetical protein